MKQKPLLILIAVIVLVAVSYYGYHRYRQAQANTTADKYIEYDKSMADMKWLQRYPQLKTVASGSMTITIDKLRTSESISELIGPIDNPYGVRNDILDKILSIVPESNPQMLKAAIMSAYYENLALYSSSDESKLFYVRKSSLAGHCLSLIDNNKLTIYTKTMRTIDSSMRNNDTREKWVSNVEQTAFAWQTIGSGLAQDEENELCQKGKY